MINGVILEERAQELKVWFVVGIQYALSEDGEDLRNQWSQHGHQLFILEYVLESINGLVDDGLMPIVLRGEQLFDQDVDVLQQVAPLTLRFEQVIAIVSQKECQSNSDQTVQIFIHEELCIDFQHGFHHQEDIGSSTQHVAHHGECDQASINPVHRAHFGEEVPILIDQELH